MPPPSRRGDMTRAVQMIRLVPELVSAPSRRAICLDNCKTSHTLRILRLTDESPRQGALNGSRKRAPSNIR
jgi:hypothetical protein